MSDLAYKNAINRRDQLRRELAEIEHFLSLWERFATSEWKHKRNDLRPDELISPETGPINVALDGPKSNISQAALKEIVVRLLREMGRPLSRGELLRELKLRDVNIVAKNPSKHLGTLMWRMQDTFLNVEGRGYWIKDVPIP